MPVSTARDGRARARWATQRVTTVAVTRTAATTPPTTSAVRSGTATAGTSTSTSGRNASGAVGGRDTKGTLPTRNAPGGGVPPQPLRPRIGDVDGQSSAGQDGDAPCDDRHRTIVGGDGGGHERDQAAHQAADGAGGNPVDARRCRPAPAPISSEPSVRPGESTRTPMTAATSATASTANQAVPPTNRARTDRRRTDHQSTPLSARYRSSTASIGPSSSSSPLAR